MGRCRTHCVEQVGEVLRDFPVASFSLDVSLIFVTKLTNPNKSQLSTSRAIIKYCSIDLVQGGELLCTYIINSSSARIRNRGDLRHETPSLRFTIGSGTRHHRSIFSFESTSSIFSNLDLMVKTNPRESLRSSYGHLKQPKTVLCVGCLRSLEANVSFELQLVQGASTIVSFFNLLIFGSIWVSDFWGSNSSWCHLWFENWWSTKFSKCRCNKWLQMQFLECWILSTNP